ncbi:hypothetical protein WJX73_002805 [Symbiochloris irregularis]|uniref:Helicase ATP-binding domain-containing protein n=1 Tax=Symbiochloris irregularis TaxID=706552 RepID=A0AAW1PL38_9CHLO
MPGEAYSQALRKLVLRLDNGSIIVGATKLDLSGNAQDFTLVPAAQAYGLGRLSQTDLSRTQYLLQELHGKVPDGEPLSSLPSGGDTLKRKAADVLPEARPPPKQQTLATRERRPTSVISEAPTQNYYEIIKQPMDLGTIQKKLQKGQYSSPQEFVADMRLTWANCHLYNKKESEVGKVGAKAARFFEDLWAKAGLDQPSGLRHRRSNAGVAATKYEPDLGPEPTKTGNGPPSGSKSKKGEPQPEMSRDHKEWLASVLSAWSENDHPYLAELEDVIRDQHDVDGSVELDFDEMDTATLWRLDAFVQSREQRGGAQYAATADHGLEEDAESAPSATPAGEGLIPSLQELSRSQSFAPVQSKHTLEAATQPDVQSGVTGSWRANAGLWAYVLDGRLLHFIWVHQQISSPASYNAGLHQQIQQLLDTVAAASNLPPKRQPGSRAEQYKLGMSEARFQLQCCGDVLPHEEPAERDPRVQTFNPDLWQRKVLDAVDMRQSALVCAPTSSGKTFISSYCMHSIIDSTKRGRVVFVAPTKALVNQVAAQVYKDFGDFPGLEGQHLHGVFTRDYRVNVENCRILITVPACLEILLLGNSQQEWVQTLQYVIFDEVHCLREGGLREGGDASSTGTVWEHMLSMLRCPFLALSATIGNPQEFVEWLTSLKQLQRHQDEQRGTPLDPGCYVPCSSLSRSGQDFLSS